MRTKSLTILTLGLVIHLSGFGQPTDRFITYYLTVEIRKSVGIRYLLYLPTGYEDDITRTWPLMLFLHGSGERGNDLSFVKRHGIPKLIEQGQNFEFILVAPQCPDFEEWTNDVLITLLDTIVANHRVDGDRVFVTGLSMGGTGTWNLALARPHRFAAVAPVCGRVHRDHPRRASLVKHLPVWVFHGAKDDVVPVAESERMVNALKQAGGNVRFTVYPDAGHDAWTETYDNPELYRWFLQHKRRKN